jgi:hypothetical protein
MIDRPELGGGTPAPDHVDAALGAKDFCLTRIARMKRIEDAPSNIEWPRWGDVELAMFATRSNGGYHACVLARRS